jgi:hypothetical protein
VTLEQEKEFLKPFLEKVLLGQILVVNDIITTFNSRSNSSHCCPDL